MEGQKLLSNQVLSELKQIKCLLYDNKTVLNVEELSQYTGLSKSKIYKLLSQKLIPTGCNPNVRQKFFLKKAIDKWLMGVSLAELDAEAENDEMLCRIDK